jgi:hypothetical protein
MRVLRACPAPDSRLSAARGQIPGHIVTTFEADGSGTLMTMRMTLPDAATRAAMLATGIEQGMEAS